MDNALTFFEGNLAGSFSTFGNAIQSLGDGVALLPDYIWNQFKTGFDTGIDLMEGIKDSITGLLQPIFDKIDEATGGILSEITSIPTKLWDKFKLSLDGISWLTNSIFEELKKIPVAIDTLLSYLDPFSENFILVIAFVPQGDYDDQIKLAFDEKFGDLITVFNMFDTLKNQNWDNEAPVFEITVPEKYGGGTHNIIDFSFYGQYRTFIHTFTTMTATFFFFIKIIHLLPKLV